MQLSLVSNVRGKVHMLAQLTLFEAMETEEEETEEEAAPSDKPGSTKIQTGFQSTV